MQLNISFLLKVSCYAYQHTGHLYFGLHYAFFDQHRKRWIFGNMYLKVYIWLPDCNIKYRTNKSYDFVCTYSNFKLHWLNRSLVCMCFVLVYLFSVNDIGMVYDMRNISWKPSKKWENLWSKIRYISRFNLPACCHHNFSKSDRSEKISTMSRLLF